MSFTIPRRELSVSKLETYRQTAINQLIAAAMKNISGMTADQLVVREALPHTDLGAQTGKGYTNEVYTTGSIAPYTWTLAYDTQVVPQLSNTQVAVFYKCWDRTVPMNITGLRFRQGQNAATTLAVFPIELMDLEEETELWFSEPVVFLPNSYPYIEVYSPQQITAGGVPLLGERFGFGCFVCEPISNVVS